MRKRIALATARRQSRLYLSPSLSSNLSPTVLTAFDIQVVEGGAAEKVLNKRCARTGKSPEVVNGNDHGTVNTVAGKDLWPVGQSPLEQFIPMRFGIIHLPACHGLSPFDFFNLETV